MNDLILWCATALPYVGLAASHSWLYFLKAAENFGPKYGDATTVINTLLIFDRIGD
jgi:hypothetical protein